MAHTWLLLAALSGCEPTKPRAVDVAPLLAELEDAFAPVSESSTSDIKDRALAVRRSTLDRLRAGPQELGVAAFERFLKTDSAQEEVRIALLDVASHTAPAAVEKDLVRMVSTYGPEFSLRLRTHAVRFLAESCPQAAVELLTPLLRAPARAITYPPQETLLDCWIVASRKTGALDERLLAEIAVALEQPADARYRAIGELSRVSSPIATNALRTVLTESGSDGYLRRKAAQAVIDGLPRAEACKLLEEIADHELDQTFLQFLADMLQKNCP